MPQGERDTNSSPFPKEALTRLTYKIGRLNRNHINCLTEQKMMKVAVLFSKRLKIVILGNLIKGVAFFSCSFTFLGQDLEVSLQGVWNMFYSTHRFLNLLFSECCDTQRPVCSELGILRY